MQLINKIKSFNLSGLIQKNKEFASFTWSNMVFLSVLLVYVLRGILEKLLRLKFLGKLFYLIKIDVLVKLLTKLMYLLDKNEDGGVTKSYLIELAFRNMKSKKNRSIITIGGVALGVGAIVFLVSLGYGLEGVVIGRVAKLDELKIADVSLGKALDVELNDEVVDKISKFENVAEVIPVVSMVSKINYNNSVFDVMSFGVDERYIDITGVEFLAGDKFKDKDRDFVYSKEINNNVLGASVETEKVSDNLLTGLGVFDFNIKENEKIMVFKDCSTDSDLLGWAVRNEGGYTGEERWGDEYLDETSDVVGIKDGSNKRYSKWIRAKIPLWKMDINEMMTPKLNNDNQQEWVVGCFEKENIVMGKSGFYSASTLDQFLEGGDVLGEATGSAELAATETAENDELFTTDVATDSAGVEWVELKTAETEKSATDLQEVGFKGSPVAEAFVSTGMLKLLGLENDKAVGSNFKISYIISDGSIGDLKGRTQSKEVEYKITGVIDDNTSNYYYFQIADAKRLGINVYSQLKVVAKDNGSLAGVRKNIETLGLKTESTADTVTRIESLFSGLRIILGLLGTIALAVASLGMFNTMTISLLERTREVGVMKTMGMLSNEVRELFLAESMIMGVGGGVLGILFGFTLGKILSLILSVISVTHGQGVINITIIPWFFSIFILIISFLVGIVTGWYPSKRARQISALNALRYE